MSWLADTSAEFKKLPPAGKIAVGLTGLAVVGIGFYEYKKSASSTPAISASGAPNTGTPTGQNGLPFLPFGTTALTDSSGNPVAFVNPPAPTPTTNPPNTSGGPLFGSRLPSGIRDILGFHANINGGQWTIVPGGQGRIWGVPGWVSGQTAANTAIGPGGKQLLVAPGATAGTGGGSSGRGGGPDVSPGKVGKTAGTGGGGDQDTNKSPMVVQRYEVKENGHIHAHKYQLGQPMK